jgi:hypothetical protein
LQRRFHHFLSLLMLLCSFVFDIVPINANNKREI